MLEKEMIALMGTTGKPCDAPKGSWTTGCLHLYDIPLLGVVVCLGNVLMRTFPYICLSGDKNLVSKVPYTRVFGLDNHFLQRLAFPYI